MNLVDNRQYAVSNELEVGDIVITQSLLHLLLVVDEEYERLYFLNVEDGQIFDGAHALEPLIEHLCEFEGGILEVIKSKNIDIVICQ